MQPRFRAAIAVLCVLAVLFFIGGAALVDRLGKIDTGTRKIECATRELAGPWVALKQTIAAPVGDETARKETTRLMGITIDRLEHIDRYCP